MAPSTLVVAIGLLAQLAVAGAAAEAVSRLDGSVACSVPDGANGIRLAAPRVPFRILGRAGDGSVRLLEEGVTDDQGGFSVAVDYTGDAVDLSLSYQGTIADATQPDVRTRLQVMDEGHGTRSEEQHVSIPAAPNGVASLGEIPFESLDCELWRIGVKMLDDYHGLLHVSPPAKQLRIKRWSGVVVGTPHAFYDYVAVRTDYLTDTPAVGEREGSLLHEFGHTIRHVADGSESHWHGDNVGYGYTRSHNTNEIFNAQYAFNEGWAQYWRAARRDGRRQYGSPHPSGYRDWNELLVANRLTELAGSVGDQTMVEVLLANPERIHSLHDFEVKLAERRGDPPPPEPSACPPDYTNDGATCRRDVQEVAKPSQPRGAGSVPGCAADQEHDAGLCYPSCGPGFHGVGPVCWGECPPGYADDGGTCRRDAHIFAKDSYGRGAGSPLPCDGDEEQNGLLCYPLCRVGFHGVGPVCWGTCQEGYADDGGTCRRDVHIVTKDSRGRGAGSPPGTCAPDHEQDAGLCYPACPVGFHSVGPVCWGTCPPGYDDHGAVCHRGTSVFTRF